MNELTSVQTDLFREEIQKRVAIPDGQFEPFLALWELKKFAKNEVIMQAETIPQFSIFVLKGCLRQFIVNDKGEESIVYFAEERHFIGDLAALRNRSKSIYCFQATELCELLTISAASWEKAFVQFTWWAFAYINGNEKWILRLHQQRADLQSLTAEERYLNLLKSKPQLVQRVPQHYIASYLGVTPERLSRIRKKMSMDEAS